MMFQADQEIFFQNSSENAQRILHPGIVVRIEGDLVTSTFEEGQLRFEEGQSLLVYYEQKREFMKQPAQIQSALPSDNETDARSLIIFQSCGEPVSAESRQCYRVSTVISDQKVSVGSQSNCPLLDVSSSGFAFISTEPYQIGNILNATITHENQPYQGTASVQSVQTLPDGRIRYGMYCSDDRNSGADLSEGLHKLSMAMQREQLQRLAGAC